LISVLAQDPSMEPKLLKKTLRLRPSNSNILL
jgi:hypothetical protein